MSKAEEKAVEYQIKTYGPNVMGGASILSEDEYMRLNMNYDFKAGYEEAEQDLGWISVKDRLPEEHISVFACRNYDGEPYNVSIYKYRRGKWYDQMTDVVYDETVDYWMPIPQLPKK